MPTKFAIGAFVQALGQNPGMEEELRRLGTEAHVYVGTGLGALDTIGRTAIHLYHAQRRWNRFWSQPERNAVLAEYLAHPERSDPTLEVPASPEDARQEEVEEAEDRWWAFWMERSTELAEYLAELREIEGLVDPRPGRDRQDRADQGEAAPPPAPAGEVGRAESPLARGFPEPAVEHRQHAGLPDQHDGAHHRPRLRAGRRLRHFRRHAQAGDRRHPARRGEGGGDRRQRPAAPRDDGRRLLRGADHLGRRAGLEAADHACAAPTARAARRSGSSATTIISRRSASGRSGSSRSRSASRRTPTTSSPPRRRGR